MLTHALTEDAEMWALEPWRAEEFAAHVERERDHLAPWLPWAATLTNVDAARDWLQAYAERAAKDTGRIYGIWLGGELVGGTLFRVFDVPAGVAEIGVWLSPRAGGRGLVTKAVQRMIEWAVRERGVQRIEWRCVPGNARSQAVAKRLGMTLDGTLREAFPHRGFRHDIEVWSVLADEWRQRR